MSGFAYNEWPIAQARAGPHDMLLRPGTAAREEEKKRIARELHDDLGQQLTALKMGLAALLADDNARAAQLRGP